MNGDSNRGGLRGLASGWATMHEERMLALPTRPYEKVSQDRENCGRAIPEDQGRRWTRRRAARRVFTNCERDPRALKYARPKADATRAHPRQPTISSSDSHLSFV